MGLGDCSYQGAKKGCREIIVPVDDDLECVEWKWCQTCKSYVPVSDFQNNRYTYDGLQRSCRKCTNAARSERKRRRKARLAAA
jgi:hypothetical protein